MNDRGHSGTLTVTEAGVSCFDVGYVEASTCLFDPSRWTLAYNSGGFSGSALTSWDSSLTNEVNLLTPPTSPGTVLCPSKSLCDGGSMHWPTGTQGPIYVGPSHQHREQMRLPIFSHTKLTNSFSQIIFRPSVL